MAPWSRGLTGAPHARADRGLKRWHPGILALGGLVLAGCGPISIVPSQTPLPDYETIVDTFEQDPVPSRDILWVIDNTFSMRDELNTLAPLFDVFVQSLSAYEIAYQVGIVTTDLSVGKGILQGLPPIITPATANASQVFSSNVKSLLDDGFSVEPEQGFGAVLTALSEDFTGPQGPNYGFLRESAGLSVIVVSDSDDFTRIPSDDPNGDPVELEVSAFIEALTELKGGADATRLMFSAIVGPADGCLGAQPGLRYLETVAALNGEALSICATDWTPLLATLGDILLTPSRRFPLSSEPIETDTMVVTIDGQTLESEGAWEYNGPTRELVFLEGAVPSLGAVIRVTYRAGLEG